MYNRHVFLALGFLSLFLYLFLSQFGYDVCVKKNFWCPVFWHDIKDAIWLGSAFLFVIPFYFLSLKYFDAWSRFAFWYIPGSFLATIWLQTGVLESSGGWMNLDSLLTDGLIWLLVVVFFVGSLIQLLREWRKANRERYANSAQ